MEKNLELYIHIPFCVKKCNYCDFVSFPCGEEEVAEYIDVLTEEIRINSELYSDYNITSIFIGGGTPSILKPEQILKLGKALSRAFDLSGLSGKKKNLFRKKEVKPSIEFTVECNPGTLDPEKLKALKEIGVNRLSMGLQSASDAELKELGRIHTFDDFLDSYNMARDAGFDNINIDLMQAVPLQTIDSWKKTLRQVYMLKPEHISAYSLMIEEGTPFYERMNSDLPLALPDEDEERLIYHLTKEILENVGYKRYEISNYALPGYECRHNTGYWRRENYLGLGLNSSSMVDNVRWKNTDDFSAYLSGDHEKLDYEKLSRADQMSEFMFLGLRMTDGISKEKFFETFGQDYDFTFGIATGKLINDGFLREYTDESEERFVALTDKGIDLSNIVLAEFLPD